MADFAFAKDGDGTQADDGVDPRGRAAGRRVRALHHAAVASRRVDQRTTALDINPAPLGRLPQPAPGARRALEVAADALQQFLVAPDETPDIAEMQGSGRLHLRVLRRRLLLRRAVQPGERRQPDLRRAARPRRRSSTARSPKFDAALAAPGLANDDGTITNLAAVGRARALLNLGPVRRGGRGRGRRADRVRVRDRARRSPLRLQNAIWSYTNQGLWSVADQRAAWGCPTSPPRTPECRRIPWTTTGTGSRNRAGRS